jgi:SPP1 family predicted phage head-tail adaptor
VSYNAFNEPIETWSTLATVFAQRADVSASESYRSQEVDSQVSTRFTVRYSSEIDDVNPRDRITFQGYVYNIVAVRESQRNRFLEIDAVATREVAAVETSP